MSRGALRVLRESVVRSDTRYLTIIHLTTVHRLLPSVRNALDIPPRILLEPAILLGFPAEFF